MIELERLRGDAARALLALGLLATMYVLARSWHQPILDQHGFRQTQTAISVYWLLKGGPWLGYETPIVGAPWRIPFEFPLYQWVVALVARSTPFLSLDQAGRVVSEAFFLGCLWPMSRIVQRMGGDKTLFHLVAGMTLLSPLYLFWSRTFMIESLALFLSLWFVAALADFLARPTTGLFAQLTVAASLAACVKITTFVGFSVAGALLVFRDMWTRRSMFDWKAWSKLYVPPTVAIVLSIGMLLLWVTYSDHLKEQTLIGGRLTATSLISWNFGTLAQRTSGEIWDVAFFRSADQALGSVGILCLVAGVASVLGRRVVAGGAVFLLLYIAPFFVFTNLHLIHNYYQYENAFFLVALVAYVAWRLGREGSFTAYALLLAVVVASDFYRFNTFFFQSMTAGFTQTRTMQLASFLRQHVPDDAMFVGFGLDLSSEVPYYAQRKALLVPNWSTPKDLSRMISAPEAFTGGTLVGAVVDCPNTLEDRPSSRSAFNAFMRAATADKSKENVADCSVFYKSS